MDDLLLGSVDFAFLKKSLLTMGIVFPDHVGMKRALVHLLWAIDR
jgi:hypothetical protein